LGKLSSAGWDSCNVGSDQNIEGSRVQGLGSKMKVYPDTVEPW
jgi:hypothetical protein